MNQPTHRAIWNFRQNLKLLNTWVDDQCSEEFMCAQLWFNSRGFTVIRRGDLPFEIHRGQKLVMSGQGKVLSYWLIRKYGQ